MAATEDQYARMTKNLVAGFPPLSRKAAECYLVLKRNENRKGTTIYNAMKALAYLVPSLGTRCPSNTTAEDCMAAVTRMREQGLSDQSVAHYNICIRSFLRHTWDTDGLPRDIKRALPISVPKGNRTTKRPIEEHEFRSLLEAANSYRVPHLRLRAQTLLWVFWETGARAREVLSFDLGSVELQADGGAYLRMKAEHSLPDGTVQKYEGLKTGPRRPYVAEAVPVLKAWMAVHPEAGNPDAPLFPLARPGQDCKRATYNAILIELRRLCKTAGIRSCQWHEFRHAAGTRSARSKWDTTMVYQQFGWVPGSRSYEDYKHLVDDDLVKQVRQDAGIGEDGQLLPKGLSDAEFDRILMKRFKKLLLTND